MQVAGSQLRNPPVKFRQERWLHIWRSISIQYVQMEAGLNSDPEMIPFGTKSVTQSMLIDLLMSCRSTQVKIASTDLWPQEMFTFSEMLALVESESSFGAYVCQYWRPGGSIATSDLVRCHAGSCKGAEQISIDVGLWVALCFLAKISFHRPTCKTTFARLTQSQAISQSFRVFITFRSMRDTTFFHFSKLNFCTKYRFFYHGDQKMSWWCRWRAVNFEIHLWSSGMNADCIWRSISIQHVQIEAGLNSDPGNDSFWVEIRDAKHVDRSTHQ